MRVFLHVRGVQVRAKPRERPYKLGDAGGLFLLVNAAGGKWWRFKYRFGGKAKLLSLGVYPEVGLKQARAKRDEGRKQLAAGVDPSEARKAAKAARGGEDSLEAVAREWHAKYAPLWVPGHAEKIIRRLERDVFPWLGGRPVGEVTAPELLRVLQRIEARGAVELAHRAHQNLGRVFHYAIATGRAERNPAAHPRSPSTRQGEAPCGHHGPQGHRRPAARHLRVSGEFHYPMRPTPGPAAIRAPWRATQGGVGRN